MIKNIFSTLVLLAAIPTFGAGYTLEKISDRNYVVKTNSGQTPKVGSHSGAILTSTGLILMDAHLNSQIEEEVVTALEPMTGAKVRAVVLSHHHEDHAGGIGFHGAKKIPVYAHPAAIALLEANKEIPVALTSELIEVMARDGIKVFSIGPAHSAGDVAIYDEHDSVLYLGDMFVNGHIGYLGEATFISWIKALEEFIQLKPKLVVGGHGAPGTLKDLEFFKTYLEEFAQSAQEHFDSKGSVEGYELPEPYRTLGSQFYLSDNLERAFELWKKGELKPKSNGICEFLTRWWK